MRKPGAHTESALEIFMEPLTAFYRMAGDVPAIRRGCGKYCQRPRNPSGNPVKRDVMMRFDRRVRG